MHSLGCALRYQTEVDVTNTLGLRTMYLDNAKSVDINLVVVFFFFKQKTAYEM